MKKFLLLIFCLFFLGAFFQPIRAQEATPTPPYSPCLGAWCPLITGVNYTCAPSYEEWLKNKSQNLWVSDPDVTALGKAGERSRQFLYWTLTHRSIDDHPVLLSVWSFVKNIVYFFLLIIAALFGLGIIIGQRTNFNLKIEVWPLILKILLLLLYVTFSARIVLLIIQLSDTMMLFFIERLGVKNLFNIFFLSAQGGSVILDSETAYKTFKGCSNLNVELLDSVKTSKFLVHFTNMTYYMVGIMFILRKVILWLLLFVSPFLALLMPFVFIRNAGWIWIGVFFQWVFYGPLFGLFLGGLAAIWGSPSHIPYNFDFSRANKMEGFIFPTTINILYGGPAQKLELLNSANYADTFAEYIIALVMLWAVTIFPWWLLRIFRDYCCDGIYATKNILLSMYDQMRANQSPFGTGPVPVPAPGGLSTGSARSLPKEEITRSVTKLETTEEIRKTKTEDISRSLSLSATKLTDIARFETNKQSKETVTKNINFLQNPMKAETPTERQKYMNIRSELFSRAVKEDKTAKQMLSSLSTSRVEQIQRREEFINSMPQQVPAAHIVSVKVNIPKEKVQSVTSSFAQSISQNTNLVQSISQNTQMPQTKVQSVLNSFSQNISQPTTKIIQNIANQTGVAAEKVSNIIQNTTNVVRQSQLIDKIAEKEKIAVDHVEKILSTIPSTIIQEKETIVNILSKDIGVPIEKTTQITKSVLASVASDRAFVKQIEKQTNLQPGQVTRVLNAFTQNINQPMIASISNVATQTGIEKEKVKEVITKTVVNLQTSRSTVKQIIQKENIKEKDLQKIVDNQIPVITDSEKNVEATISIPSSISLDEYEQVKKMWKDQYVRGEVPISDIIKSRDEWVGQDVVFITNVLNKLVSESPEVKQQGLDEIGYILPIFLINNLKGEQLMVYLKAKLEAAKEVAELQNKEKEIKEEVKETEEEELIEVEKPKVEEKEKTMEMQEELEIKDEKKESVNPEEQNNSADEVLKNNQADLIEDKDK